jgi:hypothetical protein
MGRRGPHARPTGRSCINGLCATASGPKIDYQTLLRTILEYAWASQR